MSCCGKARVAYASSPGGGATPNTGPVYFEYVGQTSMTVMGPITGGRYFFATTGARLRVDPRDRNGMLRVPNLREITGS
jgi:hypothetical protein